MSAFMLDKVHIDLLVKVAHDGPANYRRALWSAPYFLDQRLVLETRDALGQALVDENLNSIHYRYPDTIDNPDNTPGPIARYWDVPYVYEERRYRLTAVEALHAIRCYRYQSCEHPEWERSKVAEFLTDLEHSLHSALPGYDDAPWEWTASTLEKALQVNKEVR